ncbi:MAG: bL17 family ribosomal protein, partial [Bacteroidota bacterium]
VARLVKDREVVRELFSAIAPKVGARPGGYTRVVRLGQRAGDGAEMAVLELVDFNTGKEAPEKAAAPAKSRKPAPRRAPRGKAAGEEKESAAKKKPAKTAPETEESP